MITPDSPASPSLHEHFHRRDVLLAAAGAAAALAIPAAPVRAARPQVRPAPARRARNCIFMVADGMSTSTLCLGHLWLRRREQRESEWVRLWSRRGVRRAAQQTHALDSIVTDSAAAASAWGCGAHVNNRSINVLPNGKQLLPIGPHARQAGKRLGLVTNTHITDATPACFLANTPRREAEDLIARQVLERGFDLALGGGARVFSKSLLDKHHGVNVARDRAAMETAPLDRPLLGLFDHSDCPYELGRPRDVPSLSECTRYALGALSRPGSNGFLLQIEGGRIDHAAHNNDAPMLVHEQAEFERTIGVVLEWLDAGPRDDTLLIITTDHANANPGLTLYGKAGAEGFDRLAKAHHSFDWIGDKIAAMPTGAERAEKLPAIIQEATGGISLGPEELRMVVDSIVFTRVHPFAAANKWTSVLGACLADHYGVAFLSPNHTSDLTELVALGPGSELIPPYVDNVDLHGVMVSAMALPEGQMLPGMDEPMVIPERR